VFRFADAGGILRAAEKCTGVGQCRKPAAAGGTMCPSFMATRDEDHTTRARANVLRQALADPATADPWSRPELAAVMDLCLSCKACKSECPSNVDMARLKAEWEQHRHDARGVPMRSRLIAGSAAAMRRAAIAPWAYNLAVTTPGISGIVKRLLGFAQARSLPRLPGTTLTAWWRRRGGSRGTGRLGRVHFFADEFTDTLDAGVGIKAVELLERLGAEIAPEQLVLALTHSSYAYENGGQDNERLEFLGDSVLGYLVANHVYKSHPHLNEGELTKLKNAVVSAQALATAAQRLDLGSFLRLGKGEEQPTSRGGCSSTATATRRPSRRSSRP